MKTKKIILVDGNNFFASCEQMANPQLQGKPVCVLSNNDGCVIARSKEAKQLGISMGIPYFMAKKSFPDAIYLSANFSLYYEISMRMMSILQKYTDKLDIYSIDEAFLDITGCDKVFKMDYKILISKIKQEIEEKLGITVSIGLAPTKILAKMANHKAKKSTGLYEIEYKLIKEELENIPVEEIWGVGKNIARTLKSYGIFYADEILLKDDNFYKTIFYLT
jgi:nucleotidyltransferase/DNA polymerase involved in DNA repair